MGSKTTRLKRSDFTYNKSINVWCLPSGAKKFDYKDGAENNLYKKIAACIDKSIYSEELLPYKDWPEEYHLSPVRCNLLIAIRDFIGVKKRILELGCGCGSITRYLGEQGHNVIAVEGSIDRARVAGARCADLPNVRIFCSDFQDIDFTDERFDIITLIGVFEYAAVYWRSSTPYKTCLEFVNRHCCENTSFILAIENQLGLKYLNGMPEDHVGGEFYGINDLYQAEITTPQTFTKKALAQMVEETLKPKYFEFLGVFPDYKLPSVILTEDAFANERLKAHQLISGAKSRPYSPIHSPLFHEASLFRVLQKEGIAFSFANSFLLLISKEERKKIDWLAKMISNNRQKYYNTETTIRSLEGALSVEKRRLDENKAENPAFSFIIEPRSEFHSGELLSFEFERILLFSRKNSWKTLKERLIEWAMFLRENCIKDSSMIDGGWYDAIPRNIIRVDGALNYFDREWKLKEPIDIGVVIIRGIIDTFASSDRSVWLLKIPHKNIESLIREIFGALNMPVNDVLFKKAWSTEDMVYAGVYPGKNYNACYKANKKLTTENLVLQRSVLLSIQNFKKLLPWGIRQAKKLKKGVF